MVMVWYLSWSFYLFVIVIYILSLGAGTSNANANDVSDEGYLDFLLFLYTMKYMDCVSANDGKCSV